MKAGEISQATVSRRRKSTLRPASIKRPDWLAGACDALARAVRLEQTGVTPEPLRAYMLVTPARRLLRAIYGSDWAAIRGLILARIFRIDGPLQRFWSLRYRLSWLLAVIWTWGWGCCRCLRWREQWIWVWGRFDSPTPVACKCGWRGPLRWTTHTYRKIVGTGGDVEGVDECPRCGGEI